MKPAVAAAARAAGGVIALGFLLGFVDGSLLGVLSGLALITFGRGLLAPRASRPLAVAAWVGFALATGVVAARWGSLQLDDIRGAQAVLGPAVLVGPARAAGASLVASAGALLTAAAWAAVHRDGARGAWVSDGAIFALTAASVSWGPGVSGLAPVEVAGWTATTVVIALVVGFLALLLNRWRHGSLAAIGAGFGCSLVAVALIAAP